MPESKKAKAARVKQQAYSWVAYMFSHEAAEMKHFLKYGTPSDRLIQIANKRVEYISGGVKKFRMLPVSLSTSKGQKLTFSAAKAVAAYIAEIPEYAYSHFKAIENNFSHRRSDTRANVLMVAEALCHRAATEFKQEVIFSFDSINAWLKSVYSKELGYLTLRRALELLQEQGFITVTEWGVKNVRHKATRIRINFTKKIDCGFMSDDWVLMASHAMNKVYARESISRQDVLEYHIHSYTDEIAANQQAIDSISERFANNNFPKGLTPIRGKGGKPVSAKVNHATIVDDEDRPLTFEEIMQIVHDTSSIGNSS